MTDVTAEKLQDLPDELRQVLAIQKAKRLAHIDGLSKIISLKRDEAVTARKASGIEQIWREDREYYLGIDDVNRSSHPFTKAMGVDGGLQSAVAGDVKGATAFFNLIRQFVDSASARMGDILLPAGDWNFTIKKTPMPELDDIKDSAQPVVSPLGNTPLNDNGTPYTLGQFAAQENDDADKKVAKAEKQILDWLTECHYHAEARKVIEDAAQIGTGVFRGAYPAKKKARVVLNGTLKIEEKTIPTSKRVDPNNFFPDPNCGDNIQNGSYCIERDFLSPRQLRDLIGMDTYISDNIRKVLKEGPGKKNMDSEGNFKVDGVTQNDERFEVWYFFGDMNLDDLEAFQLAKPEVRDAVPAIGILINDTLIKGYLNPLDNGEYPYDVMPWQRINDSPWGVGVARQGRVAQDMMNASARTLMNNMGVSSAPQIIIRQGAITPVDGEFELVGGKFWYANEEATGSVADAFTVFHIPSMSNELQQLMQLASKTMEDATGISFLLQGQQGSAPDTVGGMELLHKNASALLRRIARVFDECVTEPHIRRYYDWLLLHGEDDEKGDLQIQAIGSSSLVEREIQAIQIGQILQMSLNPIFEMSPVKAKNELLLAQKFDPSKFDMDEKEKQAAAQKQPAPAPAIQVAQIRAASAEKIAAADVIHEQQTTVATLDHDEQINKNQTDRDTVYVQSQTERDKMTYQARMEELALKERLATLEYANKHQITLEAVKAKLTETAMRLNVQKELSQASLALEAGTRGKDMQQQDLHHAQELAQSSAIHNNDKAVELHKHNTSLQSSINKNQADAEVIKPAVEVAGKAPPGQAFER